MNKVILYKFASRSRPEKFFKAIDNIIENSVGEFYILASLDTDDSTMNNDDVIQKMSRYPQLRFVFGKSESKVHAINRDLDLVTHTSSVFHTPKWDILVNMSDDMSFIKKGFDQDIVEDMEKHFPSMDGVLHYPDGNPSGNVLMTMSIMGRLYYDHFGYVYHPDYKSLWCDNEATDVAKMLGKYVFIEKNLFEHRHPAFGKAPNDSQYVHTESFYHLDHEVYKRRKAENFSLEKFPAIK